MSEKPRIISEIISVAERPSLTIAETGRSIEIVCSSRDNVSSEASGSGCMMKPPAASVSPFLPTSTPSPTLDGVCSDWNNYRVKSSAISPEKISQAPVTGSLRPVNRVIESNPRPTPCPTDNLPFVNGSSTSG